MKTAVTRRPIVRYHGGKWLLAPWIISHMPPHRVYVEPYGGGGSVLLRKPRTFAEIYNDIDGAMVNVFRVARDHGDELVRLCELTPFSRTEYRNAYEVTDDPIEWARRVIARSFMGFGSGSVTSVTGFRANSNRAGTTPAHDWMNFPIALRTIVTRLQGVVIEQADACAVMRRHDGDATLHYVDPPYVHATRKVCNHRVYSAEMTDADHHAMIETLSELRGMVMLSGYANDLYTHALRGWTRLTRDTHADGARPRKECLWLNPRAQQHGLFT